MSRTGHAPTSGVSLALAARFSGACLALGFLSSAASGSLAREQWYDSGAKPALWPRQWVFPAAWVGNYTLMGAATARIWQQRQHPAARTALTIFAAHFLFNLAFLPVVNRVQRRGTYVAMDVTGSALAGATALAYARVSPSAARTLLPYLAWCGFTTLIKAQWWRMEQTAAGSHPPSR